MGLSVTVGMVSMFEEIGETEGAAEYRARLGRLSTALAGHGAGGYHEPAQVPSTMRRHCSSFPYSMLHFLRRAYVLMWHGTPVTPTDDCDVDGELISDVIDDSMPHLLSHSDTAGYYVPIDFATPIYLTETEQMVGSSHRLLAELRAVAPRLGVTLEADGSLSDREAARLAGHPDGAPFWRELIVWLTLHEACVASITHGAAIVFH